MITDELVFGWVPSRGKADPVLSSVKDAVELC